jgi:DNA-binding NarL/FixJ family response regulator
MRTVRFLLADPNSVFRLGVKSIVREERDFDVVEAGSLQEVVERLEQEPLLDIALVDFDLPPRGVFDAVPVLRRAGTRVIVWVQRERLSPETVYDIVRSGAVGALDKEISTAGLVRALRGVARGEAPMAREVVTLLIEGMQSATAGVRTRSQMSSLSNREREVLELVSEGRSNKEIAAELFVSEFTAKRHVQNILRKLDVHSRREASASYYSWLEGPAGLARRALDGIGRR